MAKSVLPPLRNDNSKITHRDIEFILWAKDLERRADQHVKRKKLEAPKNG